MIWGQLRASLIVLDCFPREATLAENAGMPVAQCIAGCGVLPRTHEQRIDAMNREKALWKPVRYERGHDVPLPFEPIVQPTLHPKHDTRLGSRRVDVDQPGRLLPQGSE